MTTDFKYRVSRKTWLNFYIQITREIFFFSTYIESSFPEPYSKEHSRHIVLLNKQQKIDFFKFWNPPNPLTKLAPSTEECKASRCTRSHFPRVSLMSSSWLHMHTHDAPAPFFITAFDSPRSSRRSLPRTNNVQARVLALHLIAPAIYKSIPGYYTR